VAASGAITPSAGHRIRERPLSRRGAARLNGSNGRIAAETGRGALESATATSRRSFMGIASGSPSTPSWSLRSALTRSSALQASKSERADDRLGTFNTDWRHQNWQIQTGRREYGQSFAAACDRAD
jgi:hypothetical protein